MNNPALLQTKSVVLLGASFTTGNLGVSALAWSSMKMIRKRWPDARIVLVGAGRHPAVASTRLNSRQEEFSAWPVRYCPDLLARNHIVGLWLGVLFSRFLPFLKKRLTETRSTLGELLSCDLICDITGGDSFSDIYGLSRFFRGYLLKRVCQMTGKPFILLPQTYGPFNSTMARVLARRILNHSKLIYSRDREGLTVVQGLIGITSKVKLCPDVAFVLEPVRPDTARTDQIEQLKAAGNQLVGLNISGLLYNGGYTRKNMFGMACDYPTLIKEIIAFFAGPIDQYVLLVPHVVPPAYAVEDDLAVTQDVLKNLPVELRNKVLILDGAYDQNEIKYIIGLCDFFIGARMHATIAALSQGVPAVGLAYSRKFLGVFETAGVADCVLDLRLLNNENIMDGIGDIFVRREAIRAILNNMAPKMTDNLFHLFDGLNGLAKDAK